MLDYKPPFPYPVSVTTGYSGKSARSGFFLDTPGGTKVWVLQDRVLVGAAASSPIGTANGSSFTKAGVWPFQPTYDTADYLVRDAQLAVVSTNGLWGITAMVRSSDRPRASTGAIGGFALNDLAGASARAGYFEGEHSVGATGTPAVEIVSKNTSGVDDTPTPYGGTASNGGMVVVSGGDPSYGGVADANTAYGIRFTSNNSNSPLRTFNKGIFFQRDALTGTTGLNGGGTTAVAMEMGYGQGVQWLTPSAVLAGRIVSVATAASDQSHTLTFRNNELSFDNANSEKTATLVHVASGENGVSITDAVAGSGPIIGSIAGGSDTEVPLKLQSSGLDVVRLLGSAGAVNYAAITNAATGSRVSWSVGGDDTNIGVSYVTKGTGIHAFQTNGGTTQFVVNHTASAVNRLNVKGGAAGDSPTFDASGTDTNVGIIYSTKGTGSHVFMGNSSSQTQFEVSYTASAANWLAATGNVTGNSPSLVATGSDTDIDIILTPKGSGYSRTATPTVGDSSTAVATTAFVQSAANNSFRERIRRLTLTP